VGESKNRAAEKPELARALNELITGFLRDTEAVIPLRNPTYDPKAAASQGMKRGLSSSLENKAVRFVDQGLTCVHEW
jgi:hypothetical protein